MEKQGNKVIGSRWGLIAGGEHCLVEISSIDSRTYIFPMMFCRILSGKNEGQYVCQPAGQLYPKNMLPGRVGM